MCMRCQLPLGIARPLSELDDCIRGGLAGAIDILIRPLLVTGLPGWYKCGPHEQRRFRLWTSHDTLKILHSSGLTQIV